MQVGARPAERDLQHRVQTGDRCVGGEQQPPPDQRGLTPRNPPAVGTRSGGVRAAWCWAWRPSSRRGRMGPGRAPPTVCPALLLTWRVADLLLGRGRPVLRRALHPLTGALAGPVAAALSRQRRPLTRAVVLLALAISFAASTATFNATYAQQAEADAQLTNGADVTVTEPPTATVSPDAAAALAVVPGVRAVKPLQHRFAYIG